MYQIITMIRRSVLLRDWIALGHSPASFDSVACLKHCWGLENQSQVWNIQEIQNPQTGKTEYWISQKCRCQKCGTVRNFPLMEIIFK